MPRAKARYGSREHLAELDARAKAAHKAWEEACQAVADANTSLSHQPGSDVMIRRGKELYVGKVGDVRELEDGSKEYFVYVPRPDGFGSDAYTVPSRNISPKPELEGGYAAS